MFKTKRSLHYSVALCRQRSILDPTAGFNVAVSGQFVSAIFAGWLPVEHIYMQTSKRPTFGHYLTWPWPMLRWYAWTSLWQRGQRCRESEFGALRRTRELQERLRNLCCGFVDRPNAQCYPSNLSRLSTMRSCRSWTYTWIWSSTQYTRSCIVPQIL